MALDLRMLALNHSSRPSCNPGSENYGQTSTVIETDDSAHLYANRLVAAMKEAGIGIADLARAMGISYQAVRKVVLGGQFGMENNAAAAKLLGVSSDWLATGRGKAKPAGVAPVSQAEPLLDKYGQTLVDLEAIPPGRRHRILDEITDEADRAREAAAHLGAWPAASEQDHAAPTLPPLDPDATAARLRADDQRQDELARRKRGDRLK